MALGAAAVAESCCRRSRIDSEITPRHRMSSLLVGTSMGIQR